MMSAFSNIHMAICKLHAKGVLEFRSFDAFLHFFSGPDFGLFDSMDIDADTPTLVLLEFLLEELLQFLIVLGVIDGEVEAKELGATTSDVLPVVSFAVYGYSFHRLLFVKVFHIHCEDMVGHIVGVVESC